MNRILKKLVPGVLAAALALGAVPSGITIDDIKAGADYVPETRMIKSYGGSVDTVINAKLIFHVAADDTAVTAIRIHDPDDDATINKIYQRSEWVPYKGTDAETGDYIVTIPVYPKNMGVDWKFEMLDNQGNPLLFYKGSGTLDHYSYSLNNYLDAVKNKVKDLNTDYEKATWDFSNALKNYGEWANAYFYHKDNPDKQPEDGRYEDYQFPTDGHKETEDGYHPNYPSWWNDLEPVYREEPIDPKDPNSETEQVLWGYRHKYWKSLPEEPETYRDFNAILESNDRSICNVAYQDGFKSTTLTLNDDGGPSYLTNHPYTVSLVLSDEIRIRVHYNGKSGASAGVRVGSVDQTLNDLLIHKSKTKNTHLEQPVLSCYVDSAALGFDKLDTFHYFEFKNVCPNAEYDGTDKVNVSVLGFARIINHLRTTSLKHEQSGLANTMRALVTVSATQRNYEEALKSSTPPAEEPQTT